MSVWTIHRAKGVEARLVIVLGLDEQVLPCCQALQDADPEALWEERRLFYLACTPAKDKLIPATRGCAVGDRRAGRPGS